MRANKWASLSPGSKDRPTQRMAKKQKKDRTEIGKEKMDRKLRRKNAYVL